MSLQSRIDSCTRNVGMENFFDIEETFEHQCSERLSNDHITIQEGNYKMFGATSFEVLFHEICNLKHIKSLMIHTSHYSYAFYASGKMLFVIWYGSMT